MRLIAISNSRIEKIKRTARQIKYRELSECIGQNIVINEITTIEADLVQQLDSVLPNESRMKPKEQKYLELGIAKYGIIDVDFIVSNTLLEMNYKGGIKLLKEVKFFTEIPSSDNPEAYDDAIEFSEMILQNMIDELSLSQTYLRVFLQTPTSKHWKLHLESDFFPATFVVRDACLTNVPSIWINKHFYF